MGHASQARADKHHRTAAGVAVAADGLVVVECAAGNGGHTSKRTVDHTPSAKPDLDDVGALGGGVIAAGGLVVAEVAAGDSRARTRVDDAAKGTVYLSIHLSGTAVASVATSGLIVVELTAG